MKKLLLLFLCMSICFHTLAADTQPPIRALFDEDYNWLSKEGADLMLDRAQNLGFNVIVPCVWHGRGTTWESRYAPYDDRFDPKIYVDRDPVQYLIDEAHARGIQVHPWFTVFLKRREFFQEYADATAADMFNVHSDPFRMLITNIIAEFVEKYQVDGINLDYIRSKKICQIPFCEEDYFKKTQRNLQVDILVRYVNQTARESLTNWQTDSVTKAVRSISDTTRAIKPDIVISVDTLVDNPEWKLLGAGAVQWVNDGLIDIAFHMDYRDPMKVSAITRAKALLEQPRKMVVLMGNRMELGNTVVSREPADVVRLINDAKALSPDTSAFGFYKYKYFTAEQEQAIRESIDI